MALVYTMIDTSLHTAHRLFVNCFMIAFVVGICLFINTLPVVFIFSS